DVDAAGGGVDDRAAVDGEVAGAEGVEEDAVGGAVGGDAREGVGTGCVVEVDGGAGGGRDRGLRDVDSGQAAGADEAGRGDGGEGEPSERRRAGEREGAGEGGGAAAERRPCRGAGGRGDAEDGVESRAGGALAD